MSVSKSKITQQDKEYYTKTVNEMTTEDLWKERDVDAEVLWLICSKNDDEQDWKELMKNLKEKASVKETILQNIFSTVNEHKHTKKEIKQIIDGINNIKDNTIQKKWKSTIIFIRKLLFKKFPNMIFNLPNI